MRRVAITGVGILSSIGNSFDTVGASLERGRSGVSSVSEWAELGLTSSIAGRVAGVDELRQGSGIPADQLMCMSDAALFCAVAGRQAVLDAGLTRADLESRRAGCVVGSGISGTEAVYEGGRQLYEGKPRRIRPFSVLHAMGSSCSANLAILLGIGGRSYSISSACSTSAHGIGHGFELIRAGQLDLAVVGGGEELNPVVAAAFDAMRIVLSTHFNDSPQIASRPFDVGRDGFVLAEGAGILVLEEMNRALDRGARIRGEIIGYAANSGAEDIVLPEADGRSAADCIEAALLDAGLERSAVDYVNAHATSTVQGDRAEAQALRQVFGDDGPLVSATKSMTGHSLGAAGVHELTFCIAMLESGFVAPSINIEKLDTAFEGLRIVRQIRRQKLSVVVSNTFGFGGTNAVLVVRRFDGR